MSKQLRVYARRILLIVVLTIVYFISAKLGLKLAFVNASATAVWPPTGIAIASFLIFGSKIWPAIFLGAFFANVTTAGTILTSIGIASGNTLEGFVGAYLVSRFASGRFAFEKPQDIFKFTLLAGLIAPLISATIGLSSLILGGLASLDNISSVWLTWWLGDVCGALIFTPLIIIWSNNFKIEWNFKKALEAIVVLALLILIGRAIFGDTILNQYPIDFIVFPLLLWVAFRFSVRETVTSTFVLSILAMWGTLTGFGPFAKYQSNTALLLLQSFIAITTISEILVAAVVARQRELDRLKSEFVSMASHELKSPLAAIKGLAAMILAGTYGPIDTKLTNPINNIAVSTERLINLTSDLLDVSRIESGRLLPQISSIKLSDLIKQIVDDLNLTAKLRQNKIIVSELDPSEVSADPDYISQILHNLIGNAIKFTFEGEIIISSKIEKGMMSIYVEDSGRGIEKESQPKIFEKFQQLSSVDSGRPQGTGLGLYISLQLAKKMGGNLWLKHSKTNQGTIFVFSLPLAKSK